MDTQSRAASGNEFSWKNLTLFLLTLVVVLVCLWIVWPFLPALTGAVVLSIITQRPYRWMAMRLRRATLAAAISLVLVTLSIIAPITFLVQSVGSHVLAAIRTVQNGTAERGVQELLQHSPRLADALQYSQDNINLSQAAEKAANFAGAKLAALLSGSISALTQLVVMLFLLFFLYRDRDKAAAFLRRLLPLQAEETTYLLNGVANTIHATVLGRFVVAGVQGLVAGATFAILRVEGASLLGILTMIFAMVPSFGAFLVWMPVAIYLAITHHWIQALVVVAVGALLISTLDNFLYPILVGSRLKLHTVPIFLSLLGGIWLFGIAGLILGPVTFAVADALLTIWRGRAIVPATLIPFAEK
jgi:predicted PurR-regulated permease PerM